MTQPILSSLISQKLITSAEEQQLRSVVSNESEFLKKTVKIFEGKVELFINLCGSMIGKPSQVATFNKIIDCAFSIFLEAEKNAFLPSLKHVLSSDGDLSKALTLNATDETYAITKSVFVSYVGRYRLFRSVDLNALFGLCTRVGNNENLFPAYLFEAFKVEREVALSLRSQLGRDEAANARALANKVSELHVRIALRDTIFYLNNRIVMQNPSANLLAQHFSHVATPQSSYQFAEAVSGGYVEALEKPQTQLEVMRANAALLTSKTNEVCLPLVSLLGIPVEVDVSALNQRVKDLDAAIDQNQANLKKFKGDLEAAKADANRKIDEWRASIPEKEFRIGVQIGTRF